MLDRRQNAARCIDSIDAVFFAVLIGCYVDVILESKEWGRF
jgi:hypothetical protein